MSYKLAGVIWNDDGTMANIAEYEGIPIDADTYNKLKAFEIIKEKNVDVLRIKITDSVEQYNEHKIKGCRNLTQEEYETLKKVLL